MTPKPHEMLNAYYTESSGEYDALHVTPNDEHFVALDHISGLIAQLAIESLLDVGCGTGRGYRYLRERHPDLVIMGLEPVRAMIAEATSRHGVPDDCIVHGNGEAMPFASNSFDAVCELGVLHHVSRPDLVVSEMMRVARRAVFLSDDNRFGQNRWPGRLIKFSLCRVGLWPLANRLRTRGRGFHVTPDDGVSWSYSVYDSFRHLSEWSDRLYAVPTTTTGSTSWFHPLFTASHILLVAVRDSAAGPDLAPTQGGS